MAELADAPDLGSGVYDVGVRSLSGAPNKNRNFDTKLRFFFLPKNIVLRDFLKKEKFHCDFICVFRDKNILQGCFVISHKNFSSIKMHRFSRFCIKNGANIEKSRNIWYNYVNIEVALKGVEHCGRKERKKICER